ncbi:killer cell lectin-like receptor subfamily I member 1 isoform X1 [Mesocricetus auratus]|uniref:Killer cell lectin-like receptor subfamily I member 1 isoform X1 n=2 Tax=Mesocricetus auratus TaxID=10036 RepID=A0A3Q0CFA0_MESAU|nr:killer cell lectin-like receptor subfamily I member 1 isoform X1 [Mesocricetus auratus]XP_021079292.2 killer cell lectin-like receptor subfamily I member 1 isoform X1 [Mesocricetus auratus]XP_021079293.2 killer cell lectin-like receptor subfamily I member 1 isoform X1 [Mesocricetus auratus]
MPHGKHHENTGNKEDITYAEVKMTKSPQIQRIPKAKQSPVMLSEEQLNYAELTFQRTPQLLPPKRVVRGKREGSKTTVWRMVTGILVALCVVLITTIGILLPKLLSRQEEQCRKCLLHDHLCPKEDNDTCDLCSQNWTAFGNNFYQVFREIKTWADSQSSCKELKSHLVEIDSKAELENLLVFGIDGWILLKTNETDGSWLWENGTKIEQILINDSEKKNHSCPYFSGNRFYPTDCSSKKSYTCEFNIP